jgi:hypothetical protein
MPDPFTIPTYGRARIPGSNGTLSWSGGPSNTEFAIEGITIDDAWQSTRGINANGVILQESVSAREQNISVDIIAQASSGANTTANAIAAAAFPSAMAIVTIVGADLPSDIAGTWNYKGASRAQASGAFLKYTMKLSRVWDGTSAYAALSAVT